MRTISKEKLQEVLRLHKLWYENKKGGKRANLYGANLQGADLHKADLCGADLHKADLRGANLREADLQNANLQGAYLQEANLREADLRGANLQGAYLQEADLSYAYLRGADLQEADLQEADLQEADLRYAYLQGTVLDFSCFPLWCGSFNIKADDRLLFQLLAHVARFDTSNMSEESKEIVAEIATRFGDRFCVYRNDIEKVNE